jgi:hypothetical protein
MNRSLLLFFLFVFFSAASAAQDIGISRQVLSSAGKSATMAGRNWSYTVGEPVITTLHGSARTVTQGFHQPEITSLVATYDLNLAEWQIAVFPNPSADHFTVHYSAEKGGLLEATVFDLLGHALLAGQALPEAQGSRIDASAWQAGIYLLHLRDPQTGATATFRIIRL